MEGYELRELIPIIAIAGGITIALFAIVGGMVKCYLVSRDRERSRREIAAYIAEGTMTVEEGERILGARDKKSARKA